MMANEDDSKVIDVVSKPGSVTPSSTARPIIVGHKPMIQDPMMSGGEEKPADSSEETAKPPANSRGITIAPPPESAKAAEVEVKVAPKAVTAEAAPQPQAPTAPVTRTESAQTSANSDQLAKDKATEEEKARLEAIE